MGGDPSVRSVVLLRAAGYLWGHHWCVACDGRECAGIFGGGLDRRSEATRHRRVSPTASAGHGSPLPRAAKTTDGLKAICRLGTYRKASLCGELDAEVLRGLDAIVADEHLVDQRTMGIADGP